MGLCRGISRFYFVLKETVRIFVLKMSLSRKGIWVSLFVVCFCRLVTWGEPRTLCEICNCGSGLECSGQNLTNSEMEFRVQRFAGKVNFRNALGLQFEWFTFAQFQWARGVNVKGTGISCTKIHGFRDDCNLKVRYL